MAKHQIHFVGNWYLWQSQVCQKWQYTYVYYLQLENKQILTWAEINFPTFFLSVVSVAALHHIGVTTISIYIAGSLEGREGSGDQTTDTHNTHKHTYLYRYTQQVGTYLPILALMRETHLVVLTAGTPFFYAL